MPDDNSFNEQTFSDFTRYINLADNAHDDMLRAEQLGLGGRGNMAAPGAIIRVRDKNSIGANIFFGLYCYVNGNVEIGDNVLIGPHCSITAGHHKFDPATQSFSAREQDDRPVIIGRGSWLAANVTVTAGVKIGLANLVCAGAVVTHDTPDYAIIAGLPARIVGHIDRETGEYIWEKREK